MQRVPLTVFLALGVFAQTVTVGAFPPILPDIAAAYRLEDWEVGLLAAAFGCARLCANAPVGLFITHRLRWAFALSPALVAIGLIGMAMAPSFPSLVLARLVMGVGHALGMLGGITALLRHHGGRGVASALNVFELAGMLGMLGGLVLLGTLPSRLPWNVAFLATGVPLLVPLVTLPAVFARLPPAPAANGAPLFARATSETPVRRRPLTLLAALAFAAGAMFAITWSTTEQFVTPFRASREFGLDRSRIAQLLMVWQATDVLALLPIGVLADRLGPPRVLGAVALALGIGATLIAFGGLGAMMVGLVLLGLGMAGWMLPLGVLRRETAPERVAWRAALYRIGVDAGGFGGPLLSGFLGEARIGLASAAFAVALGVIGVALLRRR